MQILYPAKQLIPQSRAVRNLVEVRRCLSFQQWQRLIQQLQKEQLLATGRLD